MPCHLIPRQGESFQNSSFLWREPKEISTGSNTWRPLFYIAKLLKAYAYLKRDGGTPEGAAKKAGAFGSQEKEYAAAIRGYSYVKVMGIVAQIKECDYKFKSGNAGTASEGELLIELISHIFN